MVPQPLIIDCDPGVDDAIALLLAFASPELQILGITTVAGNVPLHHTQTNARKICELAGIRSIPIFAGCPRAMLRSTLETAEYVHGATGLGQITLPEPQISLQEQHGVDFLIATLLAAPEPITIATLGPLTNLAITLIKEPRIISQIHEVVMMGGAITHGNVTPSAEFNIYTDPHAAAVVLTAGLNLTLISLDITHQAIATPERLSKIRTLGDPIGSTVATLLTQYSSHDMGQYGFAGAPLHDPCVIAYLLRPDLFTARPCFVEIETKSEESLGRTIVDWYGVSGKAVNVNVVETIDSDGFYQLLTERLAQLSP